VAGEKEEREAALFGSDGFIHKPFDQDYLRDVVMEKIQEVLGYRRKQKVLDKNVPSILIVDDETETVNELKYFINRIIEAKVDTAHNGTDGFNLIKDNDYDLVFLDIKMPGMNGLDVMRKIKAIKPLPDTLVITGYSDGDIAEESKEAGALGYIPKPIFLENFKRLIKDILSKKNKYIEKGS
jgi:YesN/AraC family two-component response regulator